MGELPKKTVVYVAGRYAQARSNASVAFQPTTIYIDRNRMALGTRRKRVLLVLFIPSVERDGETAIDQDHWVEEALDLLGRLFGGATAYPRARGVWRDDERGGALVKDNPIVIHCYTDPDSLEAPANTAELGRFCRRMGRETNQGEVGLIVDDEYLAVTDFIEE